VKCHKTPSNFYLISKADLYFLSNPADGEKRKGVSHLILLSSILLRSLPLRHKTKHVMVSGMCSVVATLLYCP
jgi:hypothetical protein